MSVLDDEYVFPSDKPRVVKPNEAVLEAEKNKIINKFSFPKNADSTTSQHTLQIISYNNVSNLTEYFDKGKSILENGPNIGDYFTSPGTAIGQLVDNIVGKVNEPYDLDKNNGTRGAATGIYSFYVPTPIIYASSNEYDPITLKEMLGDGLEILAAGASVLPGVETLKKLLADDSTKSGKIGGLVGDAMARYSGMSGYSIAPRVEIIYNNTPQRAFEFEFLFSPESKEEAEEIRNAIEYIRARGAPERVDTFGLLWKAPDTFDIGIYYNGELNPHVPKMANCVLTSITVDYGPYGQWITFTEGYPTGIRCRMSFREREVIDRWNIETNHY